LGLRNELEIERIFSYGVALEQSGTQKNAAFCWENIIYIMNSDKTLLLRFEASVNEFKEPIRFFLSDYDSPNFTSDGNSITFLQNGEEFLRKKKCRIPNQTFQEVEELFYKFYDTEKMKWRIPFHKSSLDLLDTNLSHVEFVTKDGELKILQRDIYAGSLVQLERRLIPEGLGLMEPEDVLPDSLSPMGMRTGDFLALFNFNDKVDIYFPEGFQYFIIDGLHNQMQGIVAGCIYDAIGTINDLGEVVDGRKIEKNRAGESQVGRTVVEPILKRRKII
jgi:hypothetical protein